MKFTVHFEGRFLDIETRSVLPEGITEAVLEQVLRELSQLQNVADSTSQAVYPDGDITISVVVEAPDPSSALSLGSTAIRSAVHAAECHTPGWTDSWCRLSVSAPGDGLSDTWSEAATSLLASH